MIMSIGDFLRAGADEIIKNMFDGSFEMDEEETKAR